MIQDIHPHHFNNRFDHASDIHDEDYIFHYDTNTLLLKVNGSNIDIPRKRDITHFPENPDYIFLFSLNNVNCFLVWNCPKVINENYVYHEISFFRTISQKEIAWVGTLGYQLKDWYEHNKFCGTCGGPTTFKNDERAILCSACGTVIYPRISPAIIVAIRCKDKLLLAQGANFRSGFYSLVAGYADIGESLEDTVIREVKEEVGLDVTNIRYYKSQPWPFSGSMMIGFLAEGDEAQPIHVDKNEIIDAAWFTKDNLPNHPTTISIAGEIIDKFIKGTLI